MSTLHRVTSKPETSNSQSRRADDNERDEDDAHEHPVRTNLLHQLSVQLTEDSDQGYDLDEQATKVRRRRRRFTVAHLKELFEKKQGAKHFNYGQTTASIVKFDLSLCVLNDLL
jgi:hypothetical protein